AHLGAYDGAVIGSIPQSFEIPDATGASGVFDFGGAPVAPGSTIAFFFSDAQGPTGGTYFFVDTRPCADLNCSLCPGVCEPADDAPPLSMLRRASMGVDIYAPEPGAPVLASGPLVVLAFLARRRAARPSSSADFQGARSPASACDLAGRGAPGGIRTPTRD